MAALVGRANVGKSSLVNRILGEKLSIVSPVAQTTRNLIRGILTEALGQVVFLDTPGIHRAQNDLGRMMNRMSRMSIEGTDVVMPVFDASAAPRQEDLGWMKKLSREETPVVAVLNKVDLGAGHADAYREAWATEAPAKTAEWFEVSAETGKGVEDLMARLFEMMPEGPLLFPEDMLSDFPRKLAVADVVREKLFHQLHDELPHNIAVWIENLEEAEGAWEVYGFIYVQKFSQKGIVIGEKGRRLRKVRRQAEAELASMYDVTVKLNLTVKVEKNWDRNFWLLKKFGYAP